MKAKSISALALYLEQEAQRLETIIDKYQTRAQNSITPVGHLNDPANNLAAENSYDATADHFERLLCQVQFAQERLAVGLYGICAACSQSISVARLEAIPYATLCIHCQSRQAQSSKTKRGVVPVR